MITFENTIDIDRQPGDVYQYLADLGHTPEWIWAITSSEKITSNRVDGVRRCSRAAVA